MKKPGVSSVFPPTQPGSLELESLFGLLNLSGEALAAIRPEGTFVYVNPSFASFLGVSTAEMVGTSWVKWVHPDDRPGSLVSGLKQAALGQQEPFTNRYIGQDGRLVTFSWKSHVDIGRGLILLCGRELGSVMVAHETIPLGPSPMDRPWRTYCPARDHVGERKAGDCGCAPEGNPRLLIQCHRPQSSSVWFRHLALATERALLLAIDFDLKWNLSHRILSMRMDAFLANLTGHEHADEIHGMVKSLFEQAGATTPIAVHLTLWDLSTGLAEVVGDGLVCEALVHTSSGDVRFYPIRPERYLEWEPGIGGALLLAYGQSQMQSVAPWALADSPGGLDLLADCGFDDGRFIIRLEDTGEENAS